MAYKLTTYGNVINLDNGMQFPASDGNRHYEEYKVFIAGGGVPQPADQPTQAQIDKSLEMNEANGVAKTWFSGQQAAINFVKLTPEAQATQIDGYTLTQLKVVVKYLSIAVSMIIKERLLP